MEIKLFTSESVTEGHPDKICDQISDAILDELLKQDKNSRVACEVAITTRVVFIFGEVTSQAQIDYAQIARNVIREIGYTSSEMGFDADTCSVLVAINTQSPDIAKGVTCSTDLHKLGAGDQGMMFGYASDETTEYMPLPIALAHKLSKKLTEARKNKEIAGLLPDGKTQVTVEYVNNKPSRIDTIIISTQHTPNLDMNCLKEELWKKVISCVLPPELNKKPIKLYVNPTGKFEKGGPFGDSGLTGRKIIVDTYGGYSRHGGGAFSGKDPTKMDRSGAYMARYIAKNIVAAGLAHQCEVQISYAIGMSQPVSICVDTFGTSPYSDLILQEMIKKVFPLTPQDIIEKFNMLSPIYRDISCYGHVGRLDIDLPWEKTDKISEIEAFMYHRFGTGIARLDLN